MAKFAPSGEKNLLPDNAGVEVGDGVECCHRVTESAWSKIFLEGSLGIISSQEQYW